MKQAIDEMSPQDMQDLLGNPKEKKSVVHNTSQSPPSAGSKNSKNLSKRHKDSNSTNMRRLNKEIQQHQKQKNEKSIKTESSPESEQSFESNTRSFEKNSNVQEVGIKRLDSSRTGSKKSCSLALPVQKRTDLTDRKSKISKLSSKSQ